MEHVRIVNMRMHFITVSLSHDGVLVTFYSQLHYHINRLVTYGLQYLEKVMWDH